MAWIKELDALRLVGIAAVVLLHATAAPVAGLPPTAPAWAVYWFLNRAVSFAAPFFFLISGLALTASHRERPLSCRRFWRHRFQSILPAYAVWTVVYLFYAARIEGRRWNTALSFLGELAGKLLTGRAFGHLYFCVVLLQLYLLFPYLLALLQRGRSWQGRLLTAALLLQVIWNVKTAGLNRAWASVFLGYGVYFVAGCVAALHLEVLTQVGRKRQAALAGLFVLLLAVVAVPQVSLALPAALRQLAVILYAVVAFWLFFVLSAGWAGRGWPSLNRAVFFIYLAHPLVLGWTGFLLASMGVERHLVLVGAKLVAGLVVPWLVYAGWQRLERRLPHLRYDARG